ncbi:hypothetical protein, partial [Pseudoalteromonas sp. SR43-5]|uniref:hypothetical protein n=1 Tax=Pseudoalteromonas sp. SR43-5 TaxID=2760941 RepID=UPI001C71E851
EFCSLFYMPAFSKLSLNNKSFKNHNYNFLNKNLEVSKNGFYLAREKIFELTNKKMITKTDLIDNKKIKASCNDL